MKPLLAALTVVFCLCIVPISARITCYDYLYGRWECSYSCCHSYYHCCHSFASVYWYAWVIIVVFILLCVCACAGGGYGYRRYYVVRRVQYPPPTTTVVTSATTLTQGYNNIGQYQPYAPPQNAPPPYKPGSGYSPAPPKY